MIFEERVSAFLQKMKDWGITKAYFQRGVSLIFFI